MGATLLFDDAEGLTDPKKSDPDKRNLLLAGNRRGAVVTVKEPGPKGVWTTRYVNAYCPRLFTAIQLPDSVLASRSIVVPLVRTADKRKANAEVLDYDGWPCHRGQLLDDLWATALANLAAMPEHETAVNCDAPLMGRNLEPWRTVLSVANWLDELGEEGLYERMTELAKVYQTERAELEVVDHLRIVMRALIRVAEETAPFAPSAPSAPFVNGEGGIPFKIATAIVTDEANQIAIDEDLAPRDKPFTNEKRVGKALSALRLKAAQRQRGEPRHRLVTLDEVHSIARAYGFPGYLHRETEHSVQTEPTVREAVPA
jgi:hypothetical protein